MAASDALFVLSQLVTLPNAVACKESIRAIAAAADPPLDTTTLGLVGEPAERFVEIAAEVMNAWGIVPTQAAKALFLRLSTDPGDTDDFGDQDPSPDQTHRPGFLSALGAGWFFTLRGGQLFAQGNVNFTNHGSTINVGPGALVFERNFPATDDSVPTYHNTGNVLVNNGATVTVPVQADQPGTYATAPSGTITIVVTHTFGTTNTVTNPSALNGQDRESRENYIKRCITAPASNAPGGPVKAYIRACNTAIDGTKVINSLGSPVAILGAQVLPASATGQVTGYLYGPSGHVSLEDVVAANANITGIPTASVPSPVGVLPDGFSIGPGYDPSTGQPNPSGTTGFASAVDQPIAVTYSARMKASAVPGGANPGTYTSGGSPPDPVSKIFTQIALALAAYFPSLGPGALDPNGSGTGSVYVPDIQDTIQASVKGLYNVVVTLPASTVSVPVGNIPTQGTPTSGTLVLV